MNDYSILCCYILVVWNFLKLRCTEKSKPINYPNVNMRIWKCTCFRTWEPVENWDLRQLAHGDGIQAHHFELCLYYFCVSFHSSQIMCRYLLTLLHTTVFQGWPVSQEESRKLSSSSQSSLLHHHNHHAASVIQAGRSPHHHHHHRGLPGGPAGAAIPGQGCPMQ